MLSSRPVQFPMDGVSYPTRTPGRALKARSENAHAMTVNGKGRNVAPKTPFHPASAQPQRLFKDQKTVLATSGRPLIDKTPMPNRIGTILFKTPLPGAVKPSKLKGEENGTPGSGQRPSSMRKHIKHPRISGKALETPTNNGNHWDVSDGDIVLESQALQQETILEQEDDLDEVEYGPPNTLDIPFQPHYDFELPDYKQVGKTLFQLAHSNLFEEVAPPPQPNISPSDLEKLNWDMIPLPDIGGCAHYMPASRRLQTKLLASDDPFFLARLDAKPPPRNVPALPSYLRSNRVPPISKPRPQSSLATTVSGARKAPLTSVTPSLPSSSSLALKGKITAAKPLTRPPTSTANVRRPAATVAKPRVAPASTSTNARRPHTSQAVISSAKATQKKTPVGVDESDAVLIKDFVVNFDEEFDFKFDA
ncbi:hypothetical protein CVT25_003557 [Psilocybe cyanescens]|uniref:Uncharacterized protein n=1 Tax=Psilocybe cyanescens TaxID=93625 RepID=A0A409WNX8_PSICY|nr:hypothetical protein CVT25_003557 [Psilocybe cyanescens]